MIQISMIPQEYVDKYNHRGGSHYGYIFARVTHGVYGLPQAVLIAHDDLVKHLETYVYRPSRKTPGILKREIRPINFKLVVDEFGANYSGK